MSASISALFLLLTSAAGGQAQIVPDGSGSELSTNSNNENLCTLRFLPQTGRMFDCQLEGGWSPILIAIFADENARETAEGWLPTVEFQLHRIDPDNSFNRVIVAQEMLDEGVISLEGELIRGFILEDLNFDGFLDYRLLKEVDPRGNHTYVGGVYDVGRDAFSPVPALEDLHRPIFLSDEELIQETFFDLPGFVRTTFYTWNGQQLAFFKEHSCRITEEDLIFYEEDADIGGRRLPLIREAVPGETQAQAMDRCIRRLNLPSRIVG